MTTFYICRHGETENNRAHRLSGWIDTPLTKQGIKDALSVATKLKDMKFDKIISSDLGRAFTSAYLISRKLSYTSEIERLQNLREVNYGNLGNQPYSAYPSEMTPHENANFVPTNGESLSQMQQRAMAAIKDLSSANPNKSILLVAHDGTINAVRASFTGEDMGTADLTRNAHDFVVKFEYEYGKIILFSEIKGGEV